MPQLPVKAPKDEKGDKETKTIASRIKTLVEGKLYSMIILSIIFIDFICMGILTMQLNSTVLIILSILDILIQGVFIMDCLLQMYSYRLAYFKDGWKILDLFTIVITIVPLGSFSKYSKFIRSVRVIRVVRVFSHISYLRFLLNVICEAIPQVAWTVLIQLIIFYSYAVIGTMWFGEQFTLWFGSVWRSLYSLFQIMTLESWSMGIARPVIAVFPQAWVFFVTFVILSSFVLMNIVVGIIVNTIQATAESNRLKEYANSGLSEKESLVLLELLHKVQDIEETLMSLMDEKKLKGKNDESERRNSIHPSTPIGEPPIAIIIDNNV